MKCCMHQLLAKSSYSTYESTLREQNGSHFKNLNDRKIVPDSDPPSVKDVNLLYQFIDRRYIEPFNVFLMIGNQIKVSELVCFKDLVPLSLRLLICLSRKLVVLTGAGISTESGIPDYRRCMSQVSSFFFQG